MIRLGLVVPNNKYMVKMVNISANEENIKLG